MICQKRLIVGLGNPGQAYEGTRHNIGFRVLNALAQEKKMSWRRIESVKGEVAQAIVEETKVFLLKPLTYMNVSGESVWLCLKYFEIPLDEMIVAVDDIALPFGKIRLRPQGSSGGHNGLKSIEAHIRTQYYARLRIGIGDREHGDLADHVLGRFREEEAQKLPEVEKQAAAVLDIFVAKGISAAMQSANQEGKNNG